MLGAFFVRKSGVQNRHLISENVVNIGRNCGRKADFWNQQNRGATRVEHRLHRRKVNSCLSRSCDAMQQDSREFLRIDERANSIQRRPLRRVKFHSRRKAAWIYGGFRQLNSLLKYLDEPALDQRSEGAAGNVEFAQGLNVELAASGGERVDNRLLIGIQLWLRRRFSFFGAGLEGRPYTISFSIEFQRTCTFAAKWSVTQHRHLPRTAGIRHVRHVFALDPFLSDHACEQRRRNAGDRTQRALARFIAHRQIIQSAVLRVLRFRIFLRPRRRSSAARQVQRHVTFFGDPVHDGATKLSIQWQHGPKHFADRGEVVVADPFPQPQQFFRESGRLVQHF